MKGKGSKSWRWLMKKQQFSFDGVICGSKMRQLPFWAVVCTIILFIFYRTTTYQYQQTQMESKLHPFFTSQDLGLNTEGLYSLPNGIVESRSDLELKPLWRTSSSNSKESVVSSCNLLAMPVGIKQKSNVDTIVQKFLSENFTIILFHYDGNLDGWLDLKWSKETTHVVAINQTKWYLKIIKSEGLEISQPALDPNSTGIHHRITIRRKRKIFHRRVYDARGKTKCSNNTEGPPCTGFVEGMAPVFSRPAWYCAWHLIQNDLVHGWGMDMKFGYCTQGDPTRKVGVVDSEYVVHQSIQTLGGQSARKVSSTNEAVKRRNGRIDVRSEIRRQSTMELKRFKERWERAVKEDKGWVDPFTRYKTNTRHPTNKS